MGTSQYKKIKNEMTTSIYENKIYKINGPTSIDAVNVIIKSLCKIKIKEKEKNIFGTGFFLKISDSNNYLIINHHIISQVTKKINIEIEIWNQKRLNLKLNKSKIKSFPEPKDIAMIEIKNNDEINEDIEFLNYDLNYKLGYSIYKNIDVLSIAHPLSENPSFESGKIVNINDFEFEHNIPTDSNSSGCPIILINNNPNLIQVIGIHKEKNSSKEFNCGTFIGEIFNNDVKSNNNYILAEIDIKDNDINKNIRIINSYEEYQRNNSPDNELDENEKNEEEIKKCQIRINNKSIPFNYFHKFETKGKYIIKYIFKIYLTKANYIFSLCDSIKSIDLSNFNLQIVSNMHCMFSQCKSLTDINLLNINTQKVTDMSWMFWGCKSLTNLDLSSLDTQNVTSMLGMFSYCESLTKLDLSKLNTQNVIYMWNLFEGCKSLKEIDISNFNTQKVTNLGRMFFGCESLINIDLSSLNTQNVTDTSHLFSGCKSLTNIDLSNFYTKNITNMRSMFYGCEKIKNIDLTTFNTKNVIDMNHMFYNCKSLDEIDLSHFNTENVTNMNGMFEKCESLKKVDITNFNFQNVDDMDNMFEGCKLLELENIIVKDKSVFESVSN